MSTKTFTLFDEATEVKVVITATAAVNPADGVDFHIELKEGIADLLGFFLDLGGDGGEITRDPNNNNVNMEGDNDIGYDYVFKLGDKGGPDDYTAETVNLSNITLEDLDGARVGIRAQSVGEDEEGSLKLRGIEDEPPPPDLTFEVEKGISNIVIYAMCEDEEVIKIKFDNFDALDCDGDEEPDELYSLTLAQLYEALGAAGHEDCTILGVTIKAGRDKDAGFSKGEGQFFDAIDDDWFETGTTEKASVTYEAAEYAEAWC